MDTFHYRANQMSRFQSLINVLLPICIIVTLVYFAIGATFVLPLVTILGVGMLLLTGIVLWIRRSLERKTLTTLVIILVGALWVMIVVFGILIPILLPAMLLAVIMTIALALPYATSQALRALNLVGWLIAMILVVLPQHITIFDPIPHPVADALVIFATAIVMGICLFLLWQFHGRLTASLLQAQTANSTLVEAQAGLETQVAERTLALQRSLAEAETARSQLAEQLALTERQREVIREMSVPVLPVSDNTLVMPLVGALDSARLIQIQEQALGRLEATRARRLLLDITGVPVIDTQVAQGLLRIAQATTLMGSEVALVGIRPEVAQAIVGLGMDLSSIHTHSDLQGALVHI